MPESIVLNYEHPPIVEVVAAVSFERLPASALAYFGTFWSNSLADVFPRIEEKPPYSPPIERFGAEIFSPKLNVFLESEFPSPRLWAVNDSGDELLQFQRDWFACNWRKVTADSSYTRWPSRREAFLQWYSKLDEYMTSARLGPLVPTQCEVTYINHISSGATWKRHSELSRIFRSIGESDLPANIERESARFGQDYLIHGPDGRPVGRLHVSVQPAFRADERSPIYVLELTARGTPVLASMNGVVEFMNLGRDTIIRTFDAITSDEIQQEWGKK